MSQADIQDFQNRQHIDVAQSDAGDERTEEQKKTDNQLADRLSILIEDANSRLTPLCKMIRKVCGILSYFELPLTFPNFTSTLRTWRPRKRKIETRANS